MMAKKKAGTPTNQGNGQDVRFGIAQRAWLAYQCLPRDPETGQPPALRELERTTGVPQPYLSDLFNHGKMGHADTFMRACWYALKWDPRWVMEGIGKAPEPPEGHFIPPCPMTKRTSGPLMKMRPELERLMAAEKSPLTPEQIERIRFVSSCVSGAQPESYWRGVIANAKMFTDRR